MNDCSHWCEKEIFESFVLSIDLFVFSCVMHIKEKKYAMLYKKAKIKTLL